MSLTLAGATLGAGAIAGLTALGGNIFSNLWNKSATDEMNARNERLTREAWSRDDTAVQRRVADLKAAGLSPVLAAGSAANTSQPISSAGSRWEGNPLAEFLSGIQQKADISKTNADTDLTKFMQNTEGWKQKLMSAQVNKTMSETLNLDNQNRVFDLDFMSKIKLRNAQANEYLKNAELLGAKTIFEQTALDKLRTEIDIAKIQRDFNNFNLATSGIRLQNDVYRDSKGIFGKLFGDLRPAFVNFDINNARNNMDTSWYWDRSN